MTDTHLQSGILIIDKPAGITSHDVVSRARKILKTRRVGHTGTLDPFATGVLVLCLNQATRLAQFLIGEEKEYVAKMRLGFSTDTGDLTGNPLGPATDAGQITPAMLSESMSHFLGRLKQVPPMFSAKKVEGVKLYELARKGRAIERTPIEVEIKELGLCDLQTPSPGALEESKTVEYTFRVVCSSGTYIRTLAEDIGKRLGIGAHLTALRRVRAGSCSIDRAVTLGELAGLAERNSVGDVLIPMSAAISFDEICLSNRQLQDISHGRPIEGGGLSGAKAKLCDRNGRLVAIAEYDVVNSLWRPRLVFSSE